MITAEESVKAAGVNPEILKTFEERGKNIDKHPELAMFEIVSYRPYDGDTKHMWDPNNADEVEAARTMFETLKKKGYTIFTVDKKTGEKDVQTREFDANAKAYIFIPRMVGG
jgi:hypothetical protein